jgi:hypothetical protein
MAQETSSSDDDENYNIKDSFLWMPGATNGPFLFDH